MKAKEKAPNFNGAFSDFLVCQLPSPHWTRTDGHEKLLVDQCLWQGDRGMRTMSVAVAVGTAVVLCTLGTLIAPASARKAEIVRHPRVRIIVTTPVEMPVPYWDSNIVPRYRYRPEDDRVDPYGPPVVPVVRYYGGWY